MENLDVNEMFLEELKKSPAIFRLDTKMMLVPIAISTVFTAAFSFVNILKNEGDRLGTILPLVCLAIIWAVTIVYLLFFFRSRKSWPAYMLIGLPVVITFILRPGILNIVLAAFAIYIIICLVVTKSAHIRTQENIERRLEFERAEIRHSIKKSLYFNEGAYPVQKDENNNTVFCPICGFSLMPGESVCGRCNPQPEMTEEKEAVEEQPKAQQEPKAANPFVPLKPVADTAVNEKTNETEAKTEDKKPSTKLGVAPSMFSTDSSQGSSFAGDPNATRSPFKPIKR